MSEPHRQVVCGLELEAYTITSRYSIGRELAFPRKGVNEPGERFRRDSSIGTEYNSPPFETIREGLLLLKSGLRKYATGRRGHRLLLAGGWRDRYAGAHLHMSLRGDVLRPDAARSLASHLHDHLPLVIAMAANSPVWGDEITDVASNRVTRASDAYFRPIRRRDLTSRWLDEMTFNRGRVRKPATLEVRVLDSNLPDFTLAAVCVLKAAALGWMTGRHATNRLRHADYLRAREDAARRGMRSLLCWNGRWMSAARCLDRFVWAHREAVAAMEVPQDVWTAFKLLRHGLNGAEILRRAALRAHDEHPPTWQRRFARRYAVALDRLLRGNDVADFASRMGVDVPGLRDTWLGRRRLRLA